LGQKRRLKGELLTSAVVRQADMHELDRCQDYPMGNSL
jgi:hypothetical protein